jgi:hypothetical protein
VENVENNGAERPAAGTECNEKLYRALVVFILASRRHQAWLHEGLGAGVCGDYCTLVFSSRIDRKIEKLKIRCGAISLSIFTSFL